MADVGSSTCCTCSLMFGCIFCDFGSIGREMLWKVLGKRFVDKIFVDVLWVSWLFFLIIDFHFVRRNSKAYRQTSPFGNDFHIFVVIRTVESIDMEQEYSSP